VSRPCGRDCVPARMPPTALCATRREAGASGFDRGAGAAVLHHRGRTAAGVLSHSQPGHMRGLGRDSLLFSSFWTVGGCNGRLDLLARDARARGRVDRMLDLLIRRQTAMPGDHP
jgi:hypothetical protein